MTIVNPVMCVWPHQARDTITHVRLRFEQGNCVEIDGEAGDWRDPDDDSCDGIEVAVRRVTG